MMRDIGAYFYYKEINLGYSLTCKTEGMTIANLSQLVDDTYKAINDWL